MTDRILGTKTVASARRVFLSGLELGVILQGRTRLVALGLKQAADASSDFVELVVFQGALRAVVGRNSGALTAAAKGDEYLCWRLLITGGCI